MPDQFDNQIEKIRQLREEAELLAEVQSRGFNQMNQSITGSLKSLMAINKEERNIADLRKKANLILAEANRITQSAISAGKILTTQQEEELALQKSIAQSQLDYADAHEKTLGIMKSQLSVGTSLKNSVFAGIQAISLKILEFVLSLPRFLMDADNALRKLTLNLGTSGNHSERIRDSTLAAGQYAAKFGMDVAKLTEIQQRYTDLTGKANTFSTESLKSVVAMAAGTSLGAEGAAEMAASFDSMGLSGTRTASLVEDIVNSSDALGLSSSAVLKTLNANLKRSNEFSFANATKGLTDMAIQANKVKISMESTFNAADKARTLEGSLAMAAQLMVLGGNFSRVDPFQLSFLARNDPAKFQAALGDMTKGVASFNRETGLFSISAYEMDRLRQASEATGVSMEDLTESAKRSAKASMAMSSIFVGSKEDKEYIASVAEMGKNGTFKIDVGGTAVELSKLTGEQISLLKTQKSTLEARAEDAKGFDATFGNFLLELKSTALPLMVFLTSLLGGVKSVMDVMREFGLGKLVIAATIFAAGVLMLKAIPLARAVGGGIGSLFGKLTGSASGATPPSISPTVGPTPGPGGGGILNRLGGMGSATTIVAIGVAAVGLGYGLKLAAEGIAELANAMKGMTGGEIMGLLGVVVGLGAAFVGFGFALSTALTTIGANPVAYAGVAVMVALGIAATAVGYGVNLATTGIAAMVSSFGALGGIDYSSLTNLMGVIGNTMSGDMGNFSKIKEIITYLKDTQTSLVTEIGKVMSRPIQLQLAGDSMMVCNIEVHNNIDGDKMVSKFSKKFQVAITDATKGMRNL